MNKRVFAARTALVLYDLIAAALVASVLVASLPGPAFAYVDPSVMTYTIQALAGVAVALSAVLGVALRRTRRKLFEVLNIDENANKEVDPDWARVGADGLAQAAPAAPSERRAKARARKRGAGDSLERGDKPAWRRRFALSLLVVGFCGFTLGIVAPFEMVAGGKKDLMFSLDEIWLIMTVVVLLCVLALSLAVSLVRGKAFSYLLALLFGGGLCCYLQAMFMNYGLPVADGNTVNYWGDHMGMVIVSSVVWVAILVLVPVLSRVNRYRAQVIMGFFSACLIVVQLVGVASLFVSPDQGDESGSRAFGITEDGLYEVSADENVIVLVLDYFDTRLMNQLLQEEPGFADQFSGFTYYDNNAGVMIPTPYAIPYLVTGVQPEIGEKVSDYHQRRYKDATFLDEIQEQGYSIGLYSNNFSLQYLSKEDAYDLVASNTINMHEVESTTLNKLGVISSLTKCALYRDMPWILKWRFWFYTDEVNQKSIEYDPDGDPESTVYVLDDPRYYERLQKYGLSFEPEGEYKGAFRFIHLNGPHFPFNMDENGLDIGMDNSSIERQAKGSLLIVQTYLQQLKDLGVYDNATIVITSDHGEWESSTDLPTDVSSPILLVKDSAKNGWADRPMQVDHAPMSHEDLFSVLLGSMGAEEEEPFVASEDEDRVRVMHMIEAEDGQVTNLLKYEITGDVLDFGNWRFTGDIWPVDER
ncbi:LTA synthase family protein [Adlercreutzia sp. ZJ242]|uniref:LTA synthase family protein n=1 Tax=Adlercreutzia sp. ZJ242 TaxID=2709409 RepID=UPI0013EBCEA6|nr:LTA synthase family protein [Adlercreutzia sp. ZJ242]